MQIDGLKVDKIEINNIGALETSGSLTNVIVGKTSVLTEGHMTVGSLFMGNVRHNVWNPEISQPALRMIHDCIIFNNTGRIEMNDEDHRYEPVGSPLEVGLLNFLVDNGVPF